MTARVQIDRARAVRIGDVADARAAMIREEIANNFRWISTISEAALGAVEFQSDHDLGRAFDQMTKIFLCAAKNFEDLVEANLYMNNLPPKPDWMSDAEFREHERRIARDENYLGWRDPDDIGADWDDPPARATAKKPNGPASGTREPAFPSTVWKDIVFDLEEGWRVDEVFPLVGLGCIYGGPSTVKTFILLHLLASVARGAPWAGREVLVKTVEPSSAEDIKQDKRKAAEILRDEFVAAYDRLADGAPKSLGLDDRSSVLKVPVDKVRDELKNRGLLETDEKGNLTATARSHFQRAKTGLVKTKGGKLVEEKGLLWRP